MALKKKTAAKAKKNVKKPAKAVAAKKPVKAAKKPVKAAKKPVKAAAKKPVKAKVKKPAKAVVKKPATKKKAAAKKVAAVEPRRKKVRKSPPKMKKMVVKPVPIPVQEELFENESKDFAFAFAESMKREQQAADARKTKAVATNAIKLPKRPTSRAKGSQTLKFSKSDLAQFRKSLMALRDSIVGKTATLKINALEQTIDRAGEDEDGSDSFMRLQNLGQVGEQNKTLQKIEEALHRIDDGTYGICEVCGQLIRKPRLQHLPFAHTCMECQSAMESNPDAIA